MPDVNIERAVQRYQRLRIVAAERQAITAALDDESAHAKAETARTLENLRRLGRSMPGRRAAATWDVDHQGRATAGGELVPVEVDPSLAEDANALRRAIKRAASEVTVARSRLRGLDHRRATRPVPIGTLLDACRAELINRRIVGV